MSAERLCLDDSVQQLAGVGPRLTEKLARLGLSTIRDVVYHLPLRYQDRTQVTPLSRARLKMEVVVEATIHANQLQYGKRRSLLVRVSDDTGMLSLRFFYFNREQQLRLAVGRRIRCFGEIRRGPQSIEMVHPEVRFLDDPSAAAMDSALTPIYPSTEGLHQLSLRKLVVQALDVLRLDGDDAQHIDALIRTHDQTKHDLPALEHALNYVHRPPFGAPLEPLWQGIHPAQQRLAIEELLAHQLSLRRLRQTTRQQRAPKFASPGELRPKLKAALGFTLTRAQQRVITEIDRDLARAQPMLRLLQGDVGAGKTAVAAMIAARVLAAHYQVALMAPTELLAEQHARTFTRWFAPNEIEVLSLTGRLTAAAKRKLHARLATAEPFIVVGTHALFQADVRFGRLGLIVVDEQHRFGVDQRLALLEKGTNGGVRPHQLIMTATPIPRTLAMTAYADLDVSVLDELPPKRRPVTTTVIPESRRDEIVARINEACTHGRQAYWVCPLIDESEVLDHQAATDTAVELSAALPRLRIGLVHGRLKELAKAEVMQRFVAGELDLLVATTVIEVGVDVPNANLMIIENSERLGLAQLHQLRGRVGRGEAQSACVLLYKSPLSETARHRLHTMRETNDGFVIAERDLELRGPGEVLGTRQTGLAAFKIADLSRDRHLLPVVRSLADAVLSSSPELGDRLIGRWLVHKVDYAKV
ncbi:MAG: ATP-dependent DNA helicase RecG [Gammaproteobacteria bacterium]|nr:ATP-dependent DNA helicase RecG [Gammaproteobacteria bacterium]